MLSDDPLSSREVYRFLHSRGRWMLFCSAFDYLSLCCCVTQRAMPRSGCVPSGPLSTSTPEAPSASVMHHGLLCLPTSACTMRVQMGDVPACARGRHLPPVAATKFAATSGKAMPFVRSSLLFLSFATLVERC